MKIKKDDTVIVLTGKYKGKTGTVLKALPGNSKLLVSGINVAKRHEKASAGGNGGILDKELPIHISNVAYYDVESQQKTRVAYKIIDNKKVRVSARTGEVL